MKVRVFLFMTLWMYSGHRILALWLTEVIKHLHLFRRIITLGINTQKYATGSLWENRGPVVWVRALLAKSDIKSFCHIIKKWLQDCIFLFYTYKSPSRHIYIYTPDSHEADGVAWEWPADVALIHLVSQTSSFISISPLAAVKSLLHTLEMESIMEMALIIANEGVSI